MQGLSAFVEKHRVASPSVIHLLTKYWANVRRETWPSLRQRVWPNSLWGRVPSQKGLSFEISMHSHTAGIESTVSHVQHRIARYFQRSDGLAENIGLCVREALANAIIHGNLEISPTLRDECWRVFETVLQERQNHPTLARRPVVLRCELNPQTVTLVIEDQGAGFEAEKVAARLRHHVLAAERAPAEALSAGGRGLMIITAVMDQVFWNAGGNRITMIKQIPPSDSK